MSATPVESPVLLPPPAPLLIPFVRPDPFFSVHAMPPRHDTTDTVQLRPRVRVKCEKEKKRERRAHQKKQNPSPRRLIRTMAPGLLCIAAHDRIRQCTALGDTVASGDSKATWNMPGGLRVLHVHLALRVPTARRLAPVGRKKAGRARAARRKRQCCRRPTTLNSTLHFLDG